MNNVLYAYLMISMEIDRNT